MKTYPYTTPDGIIDLVEKTEHDAIVSELLQRLEERTQSHLAASARDVQTIQRQSVLLDRLAQLVDDASEKADDGDIFKTEWETQARAALAAYESAKKGEQP